METVHLTRHCLGQIVNRDQLLTAVYSALQADAAGSLKTKTLHSEILLSLHPASTVSRFMSLTCPKVGQTLTSLSNQPQINDALRKFGISPSTRNLILVRVNKPTSTERAQEDVEQACVDEMSDLVQGDISSLDSLGGMADSQVDWKGLKKVQSCLRVRESVTMSHKLNLWLGCLQLYKLNEMNLASGSPSTEQELQLLESVIVSTIATKPVAN